MTSWEMLEFRNMVWYAIIEYPLKLRFVHDCCVSFRMNMQAKEKITYFCRLRSFCFAPVFQPIVCNFQ